MPTVRMQQFTVHERLKVVLVFPRTFSVLFFWFTIVFITQTHPVILLSNSKLSNKEMSKKSSPRRDDEARSESSHKKQRDETQRKSHGFWSLSRSLVVLSVLVALTAAVFYAIDCSMTKEIQLSAQQQALQSFCNETNDDITSWRNHLVGMIPDTCFNSTCIHEYLLTHHSKVESSVNELLRTEFRHGNCSKITRHLEVDIPERQYSNEKLKEEIQELEEEIERCVEPECTTEQLSLLTEEKEQLAGKIQPLLDDMFSDAAVCVSTMKQYCEEQKTKACSSMNIAHHETARAVCGLWVGVDDSIQKAKNKFLGAQPINK